MVGRAAVRAPDRTLWDVSRSAAALGPWQAGNLVGTLDQPGGKQAVDVFLAAAILAELLLHDLGELAWFADHAVFLKKLTGGVDDVPVLLGQFRELFHFPGDGFGHFRRPFVEVFQPAGFAELDGLAIGFYLHVAFTVYENSLIY